MKPEPHPRTDVEPLRGLEEVSAVKAHLAGRPRDLFLFTLGINNGLRAGDLLRLTVNQLRDLAPGASLRVRPKHGGAPIVVAVPPGAHRALQDHLRALSPPGPPADMYVFAGEPGWSPLTTARLDALVALWAEAVGLRGRYGAHSLRKTFGYLQRVLFGVGFDVLAPRFGHASPEVTRRYLEVGEADGREPVLREI